MFDELTKALGREMTQSHVDHLVGIGVPESTTIMLGCCTIETDGDLFTPAEAGRPCVICPVIDGGEVIDLCAFRPSEPHRWWLRLGGHWAIGADALDRLGVGQEMSVYRTPLDWLRAGAPETGLCIFDWQLAARKLSGVQLLADSLEHGHELARRLTLPEVRPSISVPAKLSAGA